MSIDQDLANVAVLALEIGVPGHEVALPPH